MFQVECNIETDMEMVSEQNFQTQNSYRSDSDCRKRSVYLNVPCILTNSFQDALFTSLFGFNISQTLK